MYRFIFAIGLLLHINCYSQDSIDQKKLDSLSERIKINTNELQLWQDSFTKEQNKISRVNEPQVTIELSENYIRLKEEIEERKKESKRQVYLIFAFGIIFLIILAARHLRKRRNTTKV
jgi:hypothetical protein